MTILTETQLALARESLARLMTDLVAVETYQGESAYGPVYDASADVTCGVVGSRRMVRNSQGEEVVSERTLLVASADQAYFTPRSRVTVESQVSTVIAVSPKGIGGSVLLVEVACS